MKRLLILHPFLFAVFPILFLYAHNAAEVSADEIVLPIVIAVLATLVVWLLMSFLLKDRVKAGIATSLAVFLFFSYGRLYDLLAEQGLFLPKHDQLMLGLVIFFGYSVYFLKIARRDFRGTTRLLNVVALALIVVNIVTIAPWHTKEGTISGEEGGPGEGVVDTVNLEMPGNPPDIYYIILDEYASPQTMMKYYDFDNAEFVDNLTSKGFFIAEDSSTRAIYTYCSLASSLNMEYVSDNERSDVVATKMAHSRVANSLRAAGYTYIYFGEWWELGKFEMETDRCYNFYDTEQPPTPTSDFATMLSNTTMMRPFSDYASNKEYNTYFRNGAIETLEALQETPEFESPKFVFAHILLPHEPFVFGPRGETIESGNYYNYGDKQFYLGQYQFTTAEIEKVIDTILEHSSTPPIIIVQSDHGIRSFAWRGLDVPWDEGTRIFNAYYLPGDASDSLYDSISPVNTFRLIFNEYFGAGLALLDD